MKNYEQNHSMADGTPIGLIQQILFDEQQQKQPETYHNNSLPQPPVQYTPESEYTDTHDTPYNQNNVQNDKKPQKIVEQFNGPVVQQPYVPNKNITKNSNMMKTSVKNIFYGFIITFLCFVMLYFSGMKVPRAILLTVLIGIIVTFVLMNNK